MELVSPGLGYELSDQSSRVTELRIQIIRGQLHFRYRFLIWIKDHLVAKATSQVCNPIDYVFIVGPKLAIHGYKDAPTRIFTRLLLKNALDGAWDSLIQVSRVAAEGGQSIDFLSVKVYRDVCLFSLKNGRAPQSR